MGEPEIENSPGGSSAGSYSEGYAEDGVDVTLIREMLALSPSERLDLLQDSVASLDELLRAVKAR